MWASLYFHHLALDVLMRGSSDGGDLSQPLALYVTQGNQQWIHQRNRAAARLGIQPGMPLGAALSLVTGLDLRARDEQAELEALKGIAIWAGQFTPTISLCPPEGLLLEIQGSLALFGGAQALRDRLAEGLEQLGYHARIALAPTPLGARLLSRAGYDQPLTDLKSLARILRQLPIEQLDRTEHIKQALHGMGLATLGDCLRQPRAGLARRFGPEFPAWLDRALGRIPDPRPVFQPPECFENQLLLPAEVDNTDALLFAARRLLLELAGFLRSRDSGVQGVEVILFHRGRPGSRLRVGLVAPRRDPEHLLRLLREQLERHELQAPVEGIGLCAASPLPLKPDEPDLYTGDTAQAQAWPQLIERLRARLGADAVHGLRPVPDHRPERAWQYCPPGHAVTEPRTLPRPFWLLPRPAPLEVVDGLPWLEGRLSLEQGPERIESGWWDGVDVARDYFVARGPRHERVWIFRELRRPQRWFLHGIFA